VARYSPKGHPNKPWKAEIKHKYKARFLGYFATKAEAEAAERAKRLELTGSETHKPRVISRGVQYLRPRCAETGRFVREDSDGQAMAS
jgi:hypothetical protein